MKGRVLGESMLYVMIQWIIRIMIIFIVPLFYMISRSAEDYGEWNHKYQLFFVLLGWIILCLLLWVVYQAKKQNIWVHTKLTKSISMKIIVIATISGVGLNLFINGFLWLLPLGDIFPEYGKAISSVMNHPFYMTLILTGIIMPVMEEFFFRGILLGKLRQGFGMGMAICIQAIFFGIGHMNVIQGIYAFIMGLAFGYVVMWTGSLYSAMILHIVINSTSIIWQQVVKVSLSQKELSFLIIIGAVLALMGLYLLSNEEEENEDNIVEIV